MPNKRFYTIGELARHFDEPLWRIRDAVDFLASTLGIKIQRFGRYRIIPRRLLPLVAEQLGKEAISQKK
jgi:hypothetical protein